MPSKKKHAKIDTELVLYKVQKGLESQFDNYSWDTMIDDLELTKAEKEWAHHHTGYRAIQF